MFDINDYYIGLIFPTVDYFTSSLNKKRLINRPEANPFEDLTEEQALIFGKTVLLKKNTNKYSDDEYSIYENELTYELDKTNKFGILLAYVKPFSECYPYDYKIFEQEDMLNDDSLVDEALEYPFYVVHYGYSDIYKISISVEEPMDDVRTEFFRNLLCPEDYNNIFNNSPQKRK